MKLNQLWAGALLTTSLLLGACTFTIQPEGAGATPPAASVTPEATTPEVTPEANALDNELVGTSWQWQEILIGGDAAVAPENPVNYTLTFLEGGQLAAQIDCNQAGGTYGVEDDQITIELGAMTLMGCAGPSQEDVFIEGVSTATSYTLEGDILTLTNGANPMIFTRVNLEEDADSGETGEVGEADDAVAENSLLGATWAWEQTTYGEDTSTVVSDPSRYTLTFLADGTLITQVDCNGGSGSYSLEGDSLSFGPIVTTRMGCPGDSQASTFLQDLESVSSYGMEGDKLALSLMADAGVMTFASVE